MTNGEEEEVRKIIYEELTDFFPARFGRNGEGGRHPGGDAKTPDALLKLLLLTAREPYIKAMRPY